MRVSIELGQEMVMLKEQVKRLKEHLEKLRKKDYELEAAQRLAAEAQAFVQKTKETWTHKLNAEEHEFAQKQQEDAERIARYEKKAEEDASRIALLEKEIASFKLASTTSSEGEPLSSLLDRLELSQHLATLQEEELDVELLRSMGENELRSNMAELGLSDAEVIRLSDALFAVDVS